ncbi:helix-turn-helix domain-containing protein [Amycolatopsis rhabdoformis]|uniref:Helix-turn-helix domain-containing protein n=1 Tax=Amycolatopsis rhabdoformis TaxID=1448059 RepID=A0ABZ1IG86_9PSEU|nr:helix-turn-helix domain-containing protein [Amycolatopsis rhabdoformis]WSE32455.1 helix-turn-helix domain-containing protein [Amycolatopsis rhabdoformis]
MAEPTRHDPAKAARILKVTRDSLLRRGVRGLSVADIARAAQIGKGTLYLYWRTKEELVAEVVARDFLDATGEYLAGIEADADAARPHRLCWALFRSTLEHPFVRAVQVADVHTIGLLTEHEETRRLLDLLGPGVLSRDLLELWREHGMARRDWALDHQAYALRALLAGFFTLVTGTSTEPIADLKPVFEATVRALLDPPDAPSGAVSYSGSDSGSTEAAAVAALRLLGEQRDTLRAMLAPVEI